MPRRLPPNKPGGAAARAQNLPSPDDERFQTQGGQIAQARRGAGVRAGQTAKSLAAFANLHRICETYLAGQYRIEVIDLLKTPQLAAGDQILALPTVVRRLPSPIKKVIGDLSNEARVLVGLDVQPVKA